MAKIGIDCRMYSSRFTGIGRYVFELVQHITRLDTQNEYVLFFNEPEFSSFVLPHSAHSPGGDNAASQSHHAALASLAPATPSRIKKVLVNAPYYSVREQTSYLRILQKEKLDLMHFTHFNAPLLYTRPSVVTIHDLTLSFFPGNKMNTPLRRTAYHTVLRSTVKKAKKVIVVSNNTKNDLQKLLKVPAEKIEVIYLGVDKSFHKSSPEAINTVRKKIGLPPSLPAANPAQYLLYTGVWRSHKNLQNLLRAFHLLKAEHDYPGYLVMTGRHDPVYAPSIFELAKRLRIEDKLITPGLVDEADLPPLISGAAAYVFPSLYEGFGLPVLEAMACGTPVAAARSSSLPEICGEGNALFFDPYNPSEMAIVLKKILQQPEIYEKIVTNGLRHVQQFSWEKMARQTLEIYQNKGA